MLVYGVGFSSEGFYSKTLNGKQTREHMLWMNMLARCYSNTYRNKSSYNGCLVSKEFLDFQYFADWCNHQVGYEDGFELDKDILNPNSKLYSQETCVFIPKALNMLLVNSVEAKGVTYHKQHNKFMAQIRVRGKQKFLGYFDSFGDAREVYLRNKNFYIKELIQDYKESIDNRVYSVLYELSERG